MKTLILSTILCCAVSASTVTLTDVNGASDGVYYVLPYSLTLDGTAFQAACYDFFDSVSVGQTWDAEVLTLDQAASFGRFSGTGALLKYQQVAAMFSFYPGADQAELQHAIWDVMDPGAFPTTALMASYEAQAWSAVIAGFDFSGYRLIEASGVQTFVIDLVGVPEPATAGYALTGLVLLGITRIRR